jgi:hypothetical protein
VKLQIAAKTQNEAAQQKVFVRNQTVRARELLNAGNADEALGVLEQSLQRVPGNPHLESLLSMARERLAQDQAANSSQSLDQRASDAGSRKEYGGATQILGAGQLQFEESAETNNLARPAHEFVEERENELVPAKTERGQTVSAVARWLGAFKQYIAAKPSAGGVSTTAREGWPGSALAVIVGLILVSGVMIFLVFHKGNNPHPPSNPPPNMDVHTLTNPPDSMVLVNSLPVSSGTLELPAGSRNNVQISKPGYKTKEMTQQQPQSEWNISLEPEPLHLRIVTSEKTGTVELDDHAVGDLIDGAVQDLEIPPDDRDHKLRVIVQQKPVFTVQFHAAPGARPQITSMDSRDLVVVSSMGQTATAYSANELKHVQFDDQPIANITTAGVDLPIISEQAHDLTFREGTDEKHLTVENANAPKLFIQTMATNEGTFVIRAQPGDAKLAIDDKEVKSRKHEWRLVRPPGSYKFTVSAEGYEPQSLTMLLGQGQTMQKAFTLVKKGPTAGTLVVIDGTPGSEVLLGGTKLGDLDSSGNGRFRDIAFGRYTVTLQKPGYMSRTHGTNLDPKTPEYSLRDAQLSATAGKLALSIQQKNATVKYRRLPEGKFVSGQTATEEVSPGEYEIVGQAPGMQDFQKTVTVEPGKETAVIVKFQPPSTLFQDSSQVTTNEGWYRATNSKAPVYLRSGFLNVNLIFNKPKSLGFIPKKVRWQIESAGGEEKITYELGDGGLSRVSSKAGVESDRIHGKPGVSANVQKNFSVHVKVSDNHITITNDSGDILDDYPATGYDLSKGKLGIRTDSLFLVRREN